MGLARVSDRHSRAKTHRTCAPIATIALVAAIVLAYFYELAHGGQSFCDAHGFVPAHATVSSAVTSMFLHDPASWVHVGGNLVFLLLLGTVVERVLGHARFFALFVTAGLGGAAFHFLVDPSATTPMVGVSGAIFGLMAATAMLRPRALVFVAIYALFNILALLLPESIFAMRGVAVGAHVGGFTLGFVTTFIMRTTNNARGAETSRVSPSRA